MLFLSPWSKVHRYWRKFEPTWTDITKRHTIGSKGPQKQICPHTWTVKRSHTTGILSEACSIQWIEDFSKNIFFSARFWYETIFQHQQIFVSNQSGLSHTFVKGATSTNNGLSQTSMMLNTLNLHKFKSGVILKFSKLIKEFTYKMASYSNDKLDKSFFLSSL